nr:unnamed protein product [Spirometra erinaceieuropaei]
MVSFDVTSFFTSTPKDLVIETIELLLQSKCDETENRLGRAQVLHRLKLCLRTYFTLDGKIYKQGKGTPMGSPISGFIVEAVLQRLESLVFQHHRPKFWVRYEDDTFVVLDRDRLLTFKEHLNAVFPEIQFTMKEEENNQLAFLDVHCLPETVEVELMEFSRLFLTVCAGLFTIQQRRQDDSFAHLKFEVEAETVAIPYGVLRTSKNLTGFREP